MSFSARQTGLELHRLENQQRLALLSIHGEGAHGLDQEAALDWELKAAATPYDTLQELAADYGLGWFQAQAGSIVEAIAFNVMAIDAVASRVDGEVATIRFLLAANLANEHARIGYREFN